MSAKVAVRDLRKSYGSHEAARGISFEIQEGEIFGLLGPNGAGKTTTFECVIGLREPDSGSIEVCGVNARAQPEEMKQKIGAALQSISLQDKISPREALELFGSFYRNSTPAQALLERFSLTEKADAMFDSLSGGQKQRLALALAFVNNPELIFLDEPTTGLDPQARREVHQEIAEMKRDGHTVLLTTHYIEEAEALCDRIAIINHGRIIATGSPKELIARSRALQTVTVETSQILKAGVLNRVKGVQDFKQGERNAHFRTANPVQAIHELTEFLEKERIEIIELHVQKASLEDVLIELTGKSARD